MHHKQSANKNTSLIQNQRATETGFSNGSTVNKLSPDLCTDPFVNYRMGSRLKAIQQQGSTAGGMAVANKSLHPKSSEPVINLIAQNGTNYTFIAIGSGCM